MTIIRPIFPEIRELLAALCLAILTQIPLSAILFYASSKSESESARQYSQTIAQIGPSFVIASLLVLWLVLSYKHFVGQAVAVLLALSIVSSSSVSAFDFLLDRHPIFLLTISGNARQWVPHVAILFGVTFAISLGILAVGAFLRLCCVTVEPLKEGICPKCGYDLNGLRLPISCPECGAGSSWLPASRRVWLAATKRTKYAALATILTCFACGAEFRSRYKRLLLPQLAFNRELGEPQEALSYAYSLGAFGLQPRALGLCSLTLIRDNKYICSIVPVYDQEGLCVQAYVCVLVDGTPCITKPFVFCNFENNTVRQLLFNDESPGGVLATYLLMNKQIADLEMVVHVDAESLFEYTANDVIELSEKDVLGRATKR